MKIEKKKALLELIKECDDAEYLRQISYTALLMANAVAAIKKANSLADESARRKVKKIFYDWWWKNLRFMVITVENI